MKKYLKLIMVLICVLSLSGCGKDKIVEENKADNQEPNINEVENNNQDNETEENKNPVLKLKSLTIKEKGTYKIEDFVESCETYSKEECDLKLKDDEKYTKVGTYEITIIASDKDGNSVEDKTSLVIEKEEKTNQTTDNKTSNNTSTSKPVTEAKPSTSTNNSQNTQKPSTDAKPSTSDNATTPKEEQITKVDTKKETRTEEVALKYGIKEIKTITKTYDLYSDGSKKNEKESSTSMVDKSGYNAKTSDVLNDAIANKTKYMNEVNEVLKYVNQYREEVGAAPLVIDAELTKAAMVRAIEIGYGIFSHTRPDGTDCFTVYDDINYTTWLAGENIAAGQRNPQAVTTSWRNSPGHYANMIKSEFTKLGVGFVKVDIKDTYTYYWVQLFA